MSTTQSQRVKQYMTAAAALLGSTAAQAQYQYTDIEDTTIVDGIFELDLDGDTIVDFTIEHVLDGGQLGNTTSIMLLPGDSLEGNLAMGEGLNGFAYVERVVPGTTIDENAEFTGISSTTDVGYMAFRVDGVAYPNSNWAGPLTDGYLGLRIVKNDSACYGWVRLDVADSAKSVTIKDWSFNPVKDSAHTTAFELLDVMETVLSDLDVRQEGGRLAITTGAPVGVSVYDAAGKQLASEDASKTHAFGTSSWATGMYVIRLDGDRWYHNVKVWIQ